MTASTTPDPGPDFRPTRRIVFHGMGALGVACVLAGCGGGSDSNGDSQAPEVETGAEITTTAEVPVGGGIILSDQNVVVVQPTEGDFKAFTSVCTHQGNQVTGVSDGVIACDVHGSSFSAETGEVEGGPATEALAEVPITVDGDKILAA